MSVILDVKQGSPEWLACRLGIPTASCFDKIITPKTRKPSASQDAYLAHLVAEWFLGQPIDDFKSGYMERGTGMEAEARLYYELDTDCAARQVGLVTNDDGSAGASPDSLVGDDGLLEIKCPGAAGHVGYLIHPENAISDYWCQLQGQLWICERKWVDLLSFHPTLPKVCRRVERDEVFIKALSECVNDFVVRLNAAKERLADDRDAQRAALATTEEGSDHPF